MYNLKYNFLLYARKNPFQLILLTLGLVSFAVVNTVTAFSLSLGGFLLGSIADTFRNSTSIGDVSHYQSVVDAQKARRKANLSTEKVNFAELTALRMKRQEKLHKQFLTRKKKVAKTAVALEK